MDRRAEREARAERLKVARKAAGFPSARQAAMAGGWNYETYRAHETGRNSFDNDFGREYARRFRVELDWLMLGDAAAKGEPAESMVPGGYVPIPRLDIRASAGNGRVAVIEDAASQVVAFREEWLRRLGVNPKNATIIVAEGDSMADTIGHGDLVLLDRSIDRIVDDGIYVMVYDGMVKLKRIQVKRDGVVLLKSDNKNYETEEVLPQEVPELIIEGRVRWAGGAL